MWGASVLRICACICCFAGVGLALLTVASPCGLLWAAILVAALSVLRFRRLRKWGAAVSNWMENHPRICLTAVVVVGLMIRLAFWHSHTDLSKVQGGDARVFWRWAHEMAAGTFPDTKSWTTTALHAGIIRFIFDDLLAVAVVNTGLHVLTMLGLFAMSRQLFGRVSAGVLSAALFFCNPLVVDFCFRAYSEHLYWMLLLGVFLLIGMWNATHCWCAAVMLPIAALAVLWTRGEGGLILFALVPAFYMADFILSTAFRRATTIAVILFVSIVGVGLCVGMCINERYRGVRTFLCSDDSWWPRLFGANIQTLGARNHEDKELIMRRYEQDHGVRIEPQSNACPKEFVPYIKEEIGRRWRALTLRQKARLVAAKEMCVWGPQSSSFNGWRKPYGEEVGWFLRVVVGVGMILSLARLSLRTYASRPFDVRVPFSLAPVLFCTGLFFVYAVVEANARYGRIALCLFPVYGAGAFGMSIFANGKRNGNA